MSKLLDRAEALHLNTGMHWRDAERLALSEVGIDDAAITELVGECAVLGTESLLTGDEISDFARAVLVHGSALMMALPASDQADIRSLLRAAEKVRDWMGDGCTQDEAPKPQLAALAEWAGATASAMLGASAPPSSPARCTYCDGTGDVHTVTGEWRGRCTCEAGKAQPEAGQFSSTPPAASGGAVPAALRLASALEGLQGRKSSKSACEAAAELRRLHKANEGQTRLNVTLVLENAELLRQLQAAAPQPPAAPAPAALLVRDIAADLGVSALDAINALRLMGRGQYSVNMAVTDDDARALTTHFALPQHQRRLPQRERLTDDQKRQMWRTADSVMRAWYRAFDWYMQGVKDAEAAHGIGTAASAAQGE